MKEKSVLAELIGEFGYSDAIYCLDVKNEIIGMGVNRLKNLSRRERLLVSSRKVMQYSISSRHKWCTKDTNTKLGLRKPLHMWDYRNWSPSSRTPYDDLIKYGYMSKTSVMMDCAGNDWMVGRFYLFGRDESDVLDPGRCLSLQSKLTDLHYHLMSEEIRFLNPLVDCRVVSDADVRVLELLANGAKREAIASHCNLSARGVDYRITQLKDKLSAKNNANLIRIASKTKLI